MKGWTFLKPATISWRGLAGASLLLSAATSFASRSLNAATCESLATLALPETTITVAKTEPAGTFTSAQFHLPGPPLRDLPAFCRVAGEIKPTSDSDVKFELWMPVSGWNRKFMGTGNGGWAGEIMVWEIADATRFGAAMLRPIAILGTKVEAPALRSAIPKR